MGAGDGAVARHRGRLRHAARCSTGTRASPRASPGVLVVEATGIRDVPSGPLLRIGDDRFVPGLRRLVETGARAQRRATRACSSRSSTSSRSGAGPSPRRSSRAILEVDRRAARAAWPRPPATRGWLRRRPRPSVRAHLARGAARACAARRVADAARARGARLRLPRARQGHAPAARSATLPRVLPGLFAEAARRAREAGFDGVELHYAHAYTMASFLSRLNTRDDGYGGAREQPRAAAARGARGGARARRRATTWSASATSATT